MLLTKIATFISSSNQFFDIAIIKAKLILIYQKTLFYLYN